MNPDILTGLTVLVHPLLWDDPAGQTGQIGIILDADPDHDDYTVRFDDEVQAHYSADALQVLQPFEKLYERIENRDKTMAAGIYKDMLAIALLQRYGSAKQIRTAFEMVQQNEHLQTYAMLGLNEALAERRHHRVGR